LKYFTKLLGLKPGKVEKNLKAMAKRLGLGREPAWKTG